MKSFFKSFFASLLAIVVFFGLLFVLFFGILYLILTLVLTVWKFLITAHIYKHALEVDNLASILASVGLLACNILTVSFW